MLGFSHITWALSQVTRDGGKEKFVWAESQHKAFDDLKKLLGSTMVLSLHDLQQWFDIEIDSSNYVVDIVLTQHGILYCEKYYPADKIRSPLDEDPFFAPKAEINKWFLLSI
jgi:hypothetical protein